MTLKVLKSSELQPWVGKELGKSEWVEVTQAMIDRFAEITGDTQWIHVDTQRAATEMPDGKTIAHGYLVLSLLTRLAWQTYEITGKRRSLNYGSNKVRYVSPVPSGSRVRLGVVLDAIEPTEGGNRLIFRSTMELEGVQRPALIAETISLVYD